MLHEQLGASSTQQTVASNRHLQDQISQLQTQFQLLSKSVHEESRAEFERLHRELASTSARVEAIGAEVASAAFGVQKLTQSADASDKAMASLQDAQKVLSVKIQQVGDDLSQTAGLAGRLRMEMEKKLELDVVFLRGEQDKTRLVLEQLSSEDEQIKRSLHELRAALRENSVTAKCNADGLSETNVMVQNLESRLAESMMSFKARGENLENLNTAVLRLHEDHENTKVHTADLHSSAAKLHGHVNKLMVNIENTATGLSLTQGELDKCFGFLDELSEDIRKVKGSARGMSLSMGAVSEDTNEDRAVLPSN